MKTIITYNFRKTGTPYTLVKIDETEGKAVIKDEEGKMHLISLSTLKKNYKKTEQVIEDEPQPETKPLNRHQKLAAKKIEAAYNWIIGGLENDVADGNSDEMPPIEDMFEQVYDGVMTDDFGDGYMGCNKSKTELRFAGKQFILDTIAAMFRRDGYEVPDELTKIKTSSKPSGERKNIKGDITNVGEDEVLVKAFTGMVIGVFKVYKKTSKSITVKTAKGELKFDAQTGLQINANNAKFANRIAL